MNPRRPRWRRFQFRLRTRIILALFSGPFLAWIVVPWARQLFEPSNETQIQTLSGGMCPASALPLTSNQCIQCHSVGTVTLDCQAFLKRLNSRVPGRGFRLPTEAEWEYACGIDGAFEAELGKSAWYRANSVRDPKADKAFLAVNDFAPRPVGTRQPNVWGFYDMQGNVGEWCAGGRFERGRPFHDHDRFVWAAERFSRV